MMKKNTKRKPLQKKKIISKHLQIIWMKVMLIIRGTHLIYQVRTASIHRDPQYHGFKISSRTKLETWQESRTQIDSHDLLFSIYLLC